MPEQYGFFRTAYKRQELVRAEEKSFILRKDLTYRRKKHKLNKEFQLISNRMFFTLMFLKEENEF